MGGAGLCLEGIPSNPCFTSAPSMGPAYLVRIRR
jgi:hypothetical protein